MPKPLTEAEEVEVLSREDLRSWLRENHGRPSGVWLVHHKKTSPHYLPMGDIVAECIAWGWIDSLVRGKDATRAMHWIAPRKPGSNWSGVNKAIAAELEADGLMTAAGRAAVETAKRDGSWTALDAVERLEVPEDLASALESRPPARTNWDAFPRSVRRGVLEWLLNAKRPDTRARRVEDIAAKAQMNERANQWR